MGQIWNNWKLKDRLIWVTKAVEYTLAKLYNTFETEFENYTTSDNYLIMLRDHKLDYKLWYFLLLSSFCIYHFFSSYQLIDIFPLHLGHWLSQIDQSRLNPIWRQISLRGIEAVPEQLKLLVVMWRCQEDIW